MAMTDDNLIPHDNMVYLQEETLTIIATIAALIGYVWIFLDIWPVTGGNTPPLTAWLGAISLLFGALGSMYLRTRNLHIASHLLVWSLFLSLVCVVVASHNPDAIYLLILPVIFASVLLSPKTLFFTGLLSNFTMIILRLGVPTLDALFGRQVITPLFILNSVIFASWLSSRNLYISLDWFSNSFDKAYENEQIARGQGAELRRVLKALDEVRFNLERSNYSLVLERNKAEEAKRVKQQFVQTISHELRTPLNMVVAFTELMVQSPEFYNTPLPPAYVRDLSIVYRNARHLQSLVNDVLDMARIEAAQMSIIPEDLDPVNLLEEAVTTIRSLVEMHGLKLDTRIEPDLPLIRADPTRIRQVLFNLLNNAVRFTEKGGITVSAYREKEEIIFAVADTGIGIKGSDMGRLFEDFQQLDGSTRRKHSGAGLGLAISRRFIELHHGRIWVESQVGKGSTFYFSLPALNGVATPTYHPPEINAESVEIVPQSQDKRILLAVTRDFTVSNLLNRYLPKFRIVIVNNMLDAQTVVKKILPQSIFLDTSQEHPVDVSKFIETLKGEGLSTIPIISCQFAVQQFDTTLDVASYLVKPITPQQVWDVLRNFGEDIDSVLVIDDDPDFVPLMSRILNNPLRRYNVVNAASAQEGLSLLRRYKPDVIFIDIMLPDMNGLDLIRMIRKNPDWNHIRVVIISGQDTLSKSDFIQSAVTIVKGNGMTFSNLIDFIEHTNEMF